MTRVDAMPGWLSPLLRMAGSRLSPGGRNGRLSILIYHRVLGAPDPLQPGEVDARTFEWQMRLLARQYCVLPLSEAVERIRLRSLPARAACVTFDDGYADNHDIALPILRSLSIPATFFVTTGYLDGGCMWNDMVTEAVRGATGDTLDLSPMGLPAYSIGSGQMRLNAIKDILGRIKYREQSDREKAAAAMLDLAKVNKPGGIMMRRDQVAALAASGMEIGGHTVTHPILTRLTDEKARQEIVEGKRALEDIVGAPVKLFAYPNGRPGEDYSRREVAMVREAGYVAAVSTAHGAADNDSDIYQLPRFTPWDRAPLRFNLRLLRYGRVAGQTV